jgi:hypothetical protein
MFNLSPSGGGGLVDMVFADNDVSRDQYRRNLRIPPWLFYPITAVLAIWVFGYISGLFPYLGHYQRSEKNGGILSANGNPFGTITLPWAYLFKGQTLFIDYDVEQEGKVDLTIYLYHPSNPFVGLGHYTYATIKGSSTGRFTYTVPESGLYEINPSVSGSLDAYHIKYKVFWGAVWSNGLRAMPAANGETQTMPIVDGMIDAKKELLPSL